MTKPTYTAKVTREGDWWVLDVEGIGTTQARNLRRASAIVRDMIAAVLDVGRDTFRVVIDRHTVHEMDGVPTVCRHDPDGTVVTFRDQEDE